MEILGERPAWAMSDSEKLLTLDAVRAERARLKVLELELIAELDRAEYAHELGAGDTARLLAERYRLDLPTARRLVRVATALTKHPTTAAALPDSSTPCPNPSTARPASDPESAASPEPANEAATTPGTDNEDVAPGTDGDRAASSGTDDETAEEQVDEAAGWRVHPAQAEVIMSFLDRLPTTVSIENVEFAERKLIELAATHTPSELRAAGKRIRDILDPDGPEPEEKQAYARESLTWKNAAQGLTFRGYLACENAELFRTLIRAGARPHKTVTGELDPRPHSKRQADALTTILNAASTPLTHPAPNPTPPTARAGNPGSTSDEGTEAHDSAATSPETSADTSANTSANTGLDTGAQTSASKSADTGLGTGAETSADAGLGTGAQTSASTSVNTGAETSADTGLGTSAETSAGAEVAADAGQAAGAGTGDSVASVIGHGAKTHISVTINFNDLKSAVAGATGELMFGETLSAATIRRLACDAEILPIVLGSKSQPLDVGTSQRLVTRPMRRALNARDKGCVVCGAPPVQCEAHHLHHWINGGITAVSNLVLLCKRHHIDLHSGHWQIQIIDGVVEVNRPTWADPTRIPPHKYRSPELRLVSPPTTRTPTNPWTDAAAS